jgi:hypothetical protein
MPIKDLMINIINIQIAFFRKLLKVTPLTLNNKKKTLSNCFLAEPLPNDVNIGIPNSDFHIYLTYIDDPSTLSWSWQS